MNYLLVRMLSSLFSGIVMSQMGSLSQLITRNMLASPSTLGIDGVSILWPVLMISLTLISGKDLSPLGIFLFGIPIFSAIAFLYAHLLKKKKNIEVIIFLGITFNLFVGAVFSLMQFIFMAFNYPFPTELWFGHFKYFQLDFLTCVFVFESFFLIFLFKSWKNLTLLSLGENFARAWGVNSHRIYFLAFVFISLGTFLVISFFGAFSFLGLIFPILARKIFFKRFDLKGEFIMGSVLNGAVFMFLDWVCFEFPILGAEIPVGLVVTSFGSLCLIVLVWKSGVRERLSKPEK